MKIAVFAYNFPHKKTQDTILKLLIEGINIECVIACDPVELNLPKQTLRVKPRHIDLTHPEIICKRFNIPYFVTPHNSQEAIQILRNKNIDLGVIAGARILKKEVIESVKLGILNFHPGVLPFVRGLDTLKWAIYYNNPIGVSSHIINEKVDAGRIIEIKEIPLYKDDTLIDISLRLYETEIELLPKSIERINEKQIMEFEKIDTQYGYNKSMPSELECKIPDLLRQRLNKL